jgi:hypothetical protein
MAESELVLIYSLVEQAVTYILSQPDGTLYKTTSKVTC